MSSQALGTLEGEVSGPHYGAADRAESGQPLLNGSVVPEQRAVEHGSAETVRDEQREAGPRAVPIAVSDAQNVQSAHNAPPRTETAAQQQPAPASVPEAVNTPQLSQPMPQEQPPQPQQIFTASTTRTLEPSSTTQFMESTQSVTMRVATSPPEEIPGSPEGRGSQAVWMVRLGEFFQRRVNQAAAVVAPASRSRHLDKAACNSSFELGFSGIPKGASVAVVRPRGGESDAAVASTSSSSTWCGPCRATTEGY